MPNFMPFKTISQLKSFNQNVTSETKISQKSERLLKFLTLRSCQGKIPLSLKSQEISI